MLRNNKEYNFELENIVWLDIDKIVISEVHQVLGREPDKLILESIKKDGLIQPVIVRPTSNDNYELVVGCRRFLSFKELGKRKIPAIVKDLSDFESDKIAYIENEFREQLDPIAKAKYYKYMLEKYNLNVAQLAEKLGVHKKEIYNKLDLLKLEDEVQRILSDSFKSKRVKIDSSREENEISLNNIKRNNFTEHHARILLKVKDPKLQVELAKKCAEKGWTTKKLKQEVDKRIQPKKEAKEMQRTVRATSAEDFSLKSTAKEEYRKLTGLKPVRIPDAQMLLLLERVSKQAFLQVLRLKSYFPEIADPLVNGNDRKLENLRPILLFVPQGKISYSRKELLRELNYLFPGYEPEFEEFIDKLDESDRKMLFERIIYLYATFLKYSSRRKLDTGELKRVTLRKIEVLEEQAEKYKVKVDTYGLSQAFLKLWNAVETGDHELALKSLEELFLCLEDTIHIAGYQMAELAKKLDYEVEGFNKEAKRIFKELKEQPTPWDVTISPFTSSKVKAYLDEFKEKMEVLENAVTNFDVGELKYWAELERRHNLDYIERL